MLYIQLAFKAKTDRRVAINAPTARYPKMLQFQFGQPRGLAKPQITLLRDMNVFFPVDPARKKQPA